MIKSTKLKLGFEIDKDGKTQMKSKTIANISQEATEDSLRAAANSLYQLIDGSPAETTKIVESTIE